MYTVADLALARRHLAEGEARIARLIALSKELAGDGHDQLARQAAALAQLMMVTLTHYQDHANAISAALALQRRERLADRPASRGRK